MNNRKNFDQKSSLSRASGPGELKTKTNSFYIINHFLVLNIQSLKKDLINLYMYAFTKDSKLITNIILYVNWLFTNFQKYLIT